MTSQKSILDYFYPSQVQVIEKKFLGISFFISEN